MLYYSIIINQVIKKEIRKFYNKLRSTKDTVQLLKLPPIFKFLLWFEISYEYVYNILPLSFKLLTLVLFTLLEKILIREDKKQISKWKSVEN